MRSALGPHTVVAQQPQLSCIATVYPDAGIVLLPKVLVAALEALVEDLL